MSYRRRRYYRRRYPYRRRRRRYTTSRVGKALAIAGTALYTAKKIQGLVNTEFKYKDITEDALTPVTAPDIYGLNQISQGDGASYRDGDSIRCKSIRLGITGKHNDSGGNVQFVRIILFIYKEPRGGDPSPSNILEDATDIKSFPLYKYRSRYTILKDKTYTIEKNGNDGFNFEYYKRLNMKTEFDGTATIPEKNGLYLLFMSTEGTYGPNCAIKARLTYVDN